MSNTTFNQDTINVTYDNKTIQVQKNLRICEIIPEVKNFIAVEVNNEVKSISERLNVNAVIKPVSIEQSAGMTIYRRSLTFLMAKVISQLYPQVRLHIGHSICSGYYFDADNIELTDEVLSAVKDEMKKQVKQDKAILRDEISYCEAVSFLKEQNRTDKLNLLNGINTAMLPIYRCDDYIEILDEPIAGHTGLLECFDIIKYMSGFIILFPRVSDVNHVAKFVPQDNIFEVYHSSKRSLHVDNVGDLNNLVMSNQIADFVQMSEYLQHQNIFNLSERILERKNEVKLITIAGPSSSGKTTFSKRLSLQLRALGVNPVTISIDDYYVDRVKTPRDKDGNYDFECLEALNIDMLNDNLSNLIAGKTVHLPVYNFQTGLSSIREESVALGKNEVIIIEGIHGLNDKLTYSISPNQKFKIYISALTQINLDDNNRIATSDNRLIRRIVRDYKYRGYSAQRTLSMWQSVRSGEKKYIFPFQNDADGYFNSALHYEIAVLKPFITPLLTQIKQDAHEYSEAMRLLSFLKYFVAIDSSMIPNTSIMREFIGGSFFHY